MKFFWKLYFSIMIITISCFSIGGYMLIQSGFHSSLEREIENAYNENDIISSILNSLLFYDNNIYDKSLSIIGNYTIDGSDLRDYLDEITIQNDTNILFCLRNQTGNILYMDGSFYNDDDSVKKLTIKQQGYRIVKEKDQYYIHTIKPFDDHMYIENKHEMTSLFHNRDEQFQMLLFYSIALLMISAIVIYIVTRWLVSPIYKLSQATKKITLEDSFEPIQVKGDDEIAQLTNDFNIMSDRLLTSMNKIQRNAEKQSLFVGNFAHELKTPLTTMIGYGDILRSKKVSEEQMIIYADHIVKEGKRLESLSMKLLDLIVLEKHDFVLKKMMMSDFLNGIAEEYLISKNNITLTVQVEDGYAMIEPDLMKTVMINLLDNACKATDYCGNIEIMGEKCENGYTIIVKDNGRGMPSDEISHIMEAFYMIDKSRSRTQGGAGLGLAIVKKILNVHHADISFESEINQGTSVYIHLREVYDDEK